MELAGETAMAQGVSGPALGVRGRDWVESEFESVFFQYYTRVVQVLYRMLGDRAQAEEVASDAFMKLFEQQAPLAAYQNLGGWLYRTATRMGIDSLRSAARRGTMSHKPPKDWSGPRIAPARSIRCCGPNGRAPSEPRWRA